MDAREHGVAVILSHDLAGEKTPEDITRWFNSGPHTRYAGIVFVAGVRVSRDAGFLWWARSRQCRGWNALFVLRYKADDATQRWLVLGKKKV